MAACRGIRNPIMEGTKVFIDQPILKRVDSSLPAGMSRTAWVAYLLQIGLANAPLVPTTAQKVRG